MRLICILLIGLFILSNINGYVYRPVEIEAFANIEKEYKLINKYGINPKFTEFECKLYYLDLYVKNVIIPKAVKREKELLEFKKLNNTKVPITVIPIPIYWLCNYTQHTPDYINKVLQAIDDKIYIREKYNIEPFEPDITKVKL